VSTKESVCYGVERWLSKLEYEIKRKPDKYKNLKRLLTAGWRDDEYVYTRTRQNIITKYKHSNKLPKYEIMVKYNISRGELI